MNVKTLPLVQLMPPALRPQRVITVPVNKVFCPAMDKPTFRAQEWNVKMLMNVLKVTRLVVLTQSAPISQDEPGAVVLVASLLPLVKVGSWEVQVIFSAQMLTSV